MLTDSVIPASARARLEDALVLVGAIRSMDFWEVLCFFRLWPQNAYESAWGSFVDFCKSG